MKKSIYILLFFTFTFSFCKKEEAKYQVDIQPNTLIILNEGIFTYGNASITLYDFNTGKIIQNAFFKANNKLLGDIAQSGFILNEYLYIVINNSGKVIKTDLSSLIEISEINNLVSPRYSALISANQIVLTDLYSHFLNIFDAENMSLLKKVYIGHSSEQIIIHNDFLYTVSWNNDSMLLKISISDFKIIDSLALTYQPNSLVIDKNNNLWILCDGGLWSNADTLMNPALWQVNPENLQIIKKLKFEDITLSPSHLCINATKDTIFFLISSWTNTNNSKYGVYRMSIRDSLPTSPWIKQSTQTFYSLQYIKEKKWIVITDARDFTTNGQVLIYNSLANLLFTIDAGIIPGYVIYKN